MPNDFEFYQDDLTCLFCGLTYDNLRELKIHSFIHSPCGEKCIPIFNLIHEVRNSEIQDVHDKIGKHSSDFQVDATMSCSSVDEFNLLDNAKDRVIKRRDSGYATPDATDERNFSNITEEEIAKSSNCYSISDKNKLKMSKNKNIKSCDLSYTKSYSNHELKILENESVKRSNKIYSITDAVNELNLLKNNVENKFVKSCNSDYNKWDTIKDLSLLKNSIEKEKGKSGINGYHVSDAVIGMNLKYEVRNNDAKNCNNVYTKSDATKKLSLLKTKDKDENAENRKSDCYATSEAVNEMNFLKGNVKEDSVKSSDSGYSSPSPPFPNT